MFINELKTVYKGSVIIKRKSGKIISEIYKGYLGLLTDNNILSLAVYHIVNIPGEKVYDNPIIKIYTK